MEIIRGFAQAEKRLSRRDKAGFFLDETQRAELAKRLGVDPEKAVNGIIDDVRKQGDKAVLEYTLKFDRASISKLEVSPAEIKQAAGEISAELFEALKLAAAQVRAYHRFQKEAVWKAAEIMQGKQLIRPLERVGLYVPGGKAFYPSTVLMTAIPAKEAGVNEIILVTPPGADGKIPAPTLAAAYIAGVDKVFACGGAQAVAALAFGTKSIPKVDKICGPGNIFVTLAKKAVFGVVDIDGLQGPSEVLILADQYANAEYCASDILAQAEHDVLASPIMVTTSAELAKRVNDIVETKTDTCTRKDIIRQSLRDNGLIAVVDNMDEAIKLANMYAAEHLCLLVKDSEQYLSRINHAGCIFYGEKASVVMGDYVAGPSHALPTSGTARFSSPLNILDFVKYIDIVNVSKEEVAKLGKAAATIARAEGLECHAEAALKRMG
ncbi:MULTISPECIES: histidinol dehydrogenase [Dehalococcoides]|uniref:Histidinol dehydrogenase n=2 Tax=root TaxID=1 RepID=A0AB33HPW5_9CHLR|nr:MULTISPECIES: histidinol dehydrogenase [Dehalococcoides]MEA4879205.1 histidinol dehydrogenase [Dehalococcoides mccartyi]POZ58971.1 Histidinol dehydrogenase [Dehalococcoides mccartyi]BAZ97338.1 histidinol dehydrogenase [Dehalococcoides mccartyi]